MILPLLIAAAAPSRSAVVPARTAAATAPAASRSAAEVRHDQCVDLATGNDPAAGARNASGWLLEGGGFLAHQCLGIAYATQQSWAAAGGEFEAAAQAAETQRDARAANYWQQAGNAWIAAGDGQRARTALDAALARGTLSGLDRGEAYLDRARAFVAAGDTAGARADLDHAIVDAAADPLAWLLSATLARRTGDLPRARHAIDQAVHLSADDAAVQLEAGNVAASEGNEAAAQAAWNEASRVQPTSPAAASARAALVQFATTPTAIPAVATPAHRPARH